MVLESERLVELELVLKLLELTEAVFVKLLYAVRVFETLVRAGKRSKEDIVARFVS
jgi:hypothetical protein